MDNKRALNIAVVILGAAAGISTTVLVNSAVAQQGPVSSSDQWIEATHLPPLLTAASERVELRYDVYCTPARQEQVDEPCAAAGTAFVRAGDSGPFQELPLREEPGAVHGRFVADVPGDIAGSRTGFSYYAVLRSTATGRTVTVPSGAATAPHRSLPLGSATVVRLGTHAFGQLRVAGDRVVDAPWGTGPAQVGLEQGRNLTPIGASSFDVDGAGTVHVLDEANRRLLRWRRGAQQAEVVPLPINGTIADLAVAADGSFHVLETTGGSHSARAQLRTFGKDGSARGTIVVAERASVVQSGPDGPVVLQQASGQWAPVSAGAHALSVVAQSRSGRPGRPLPGGGEVLVLRRGKEIRLALVGQRGTRRTWRLISETEIAEVQLAEPLGSRLVVVARVFDDAQDEFVVLVLDDRGIVRQFAVPSADWAETAPLSRFHLVGSSLYQLGSSAAGAFVDRYDLEVK